MLDREQWERAVAFHGHACPGLAIGFKAAEGAIEELGLDDSKLPAPDEELVCIPENDACGVDAIQALLGCTYGKSNLIPRLRGKQAFSFFVRDTGEGVRLVFAQSGRGGRSREEFQEYLLATPYAELFSTEEAGFDLPEKARSFDSQACAICGELTAEYALRMQEGKLVCGECYDEYEREGFSGPVD